MSKISNALRMLILLKSRGKMTINELARELETSKRQIARYREDLEKAEIYVTTIPGKYGGYKLDSKDYILGLNVTNEEYESLLATKKYLECENFIQIKEFKHLADKISALKEDDNYTNGELNERLFIKNIKSNYDLEKEKESWFDLKASIIARKKINILYQGLNNERMWRSIQPYSILHYKGAMYLIGFCEYRQAIREFKVSRIQEYQLLDERFNKDSNFNINGYMKDCFGIYKDKDIYIKLKIKHPMSQIIKEKVWVENQQILDLDKNTILYEASMRGLTEVKSWILGMGSLVEVLEPEELKEEIKKELEKMLNIYD